ncbi:MAG: metalloregulator ArsR/SmtB family transcription factor [Gammaproteobacteria bacterium]|nr:metalloregulator ArsR/SmtB family transcription factor [Gammaproteobacteria bacterium]
MSNYRNIEITQLAQAFKALSHPNRLQIYMQLLNCCAPGTSCSAQADQSFCVSELGEPLDIAASTLSHHIKELNRAGLLQMTRRGQHIDCRIDTEMLGQLQNFINLKTD